MTAPHRPVIRHPAPCRLCWIARTHAELLDGLRCDTCCGAELDRILAGRPATPAPDWLDEARYWLWLALAAALTIGWLIVLGNAGRAAVRVIGS